MRDMLVALCYSKKCNIPNAWIEEVRGAVKHCPFPSDKITIDGESFGYKDIEQRSIEDIAAYIYVIDKSCKPKKKKALTKKKRVKK